MKAYEFTINGRPWVVTADNLQAAIKKAQDIEAAEALADDTKADAALVSKYQAKEVNNGKIK